MLETRSASEKEVRMSVLTEARETYGNKNQILVCMEELNELACALAKYPRYNDEEEATKDLSDKVLDEVADVYIILEHVKAIFGYTPKQIDDRIVMKLARVHRWLKESNSMQQTIDDRKVESEPCESDRFCGKCIHRNTSDKEIFYGWCKPCMEAQATEGISPFKTVKED